MLNELTYSENKFLFNKISGKRDYVAYYIMQFSKFEKMLIEDVMLQLDCDEKTFMKLALCKAPTYNDENFAERISKIAAYSEINSEKIIEIIKKVSIIERFRTSNIQESHLLAARKKEQEGNQNNE